MRLLNGPDGEVLGLAISPDGSALIAAIAGQGVYLWNLASVGKPVCLSDEPIDRDPNLFFSPDGRTANWTSEYGWKTYDRDARDTEVRRLDAPGKLVWLAPVPDGRILSRHIFPDMAVIGWRPDPDDDWVRCWTVRITNLSINNHGQTLCPTGRRFAVIGRVAEGSEPNTRWWEQNPFCVNLHLSATGAIEASEPFPYDRVDRLAFSPDGSLLVAVHQMTLLAWPVPTLGEPRLIRNTSRQHFTSIAIHPSGNYLFASSNDGTVHLFDTATWRRVTRFSWKLGRLRAVAVSPDGMLAAAGGDRGEIVVWDVDV